MSTAQSNDGKGAPNCRPSSHHSSFCIHHSAFTLIELLVVVGIIAILAGILLPMILKSYGAADRTRTAADLNAISIALDAYKQDFGDYPRVDVPGTGFAVLGRSLIGPGPGTDTSQMLTGGSANAGDVQYAAPNQWVALHDTAVVAGPGIDWAQYNYTDGAAGPGFRVRPGGKIYPSYLPADKFKMHGLAILDHNGSPVLYFPQSPVKHNLSAAGAVYVGRASAGPVPMYNFDDDARLIASKTPEDSADLPNYFKSLARMRAMLGDLNANGTIDAGETPVTTVPYLLWSCGADSFFGPREDIDTIKTDATLVRRAVSRCDDVTNFPLGQ